MRSVGIGGRALVLAAVVPALHGCAVIAGLEDRKVGEGARSSLVVLASDQAFPYGVALDADAVYWTNQGGRDEDGEIRVGAVRKRLKQEATIIDLASSPNDSPQAIALDEANVYWSSAPVSDDACTVALDRMHQISKEPPSPDKGRIELWQGCGEVAALALDPTRVYGARPTSHRITSPAKGKTSSSKELYPLDTDGEPFGVAADAENVYFTDRLNKVIYVDDKLGTTTSLVDGLAEAPGHLVLDDTHVYWLAEHSVLRYPRRPASGETPVVLHEDVQTPGGIAAHGDHLYVTDSEPGFVYRIQKDGLAKPVRIAEDQGYPTGIAADETGVYWANTRSKEIMRWSAE